MLSIAATGITLGVTLLLYFVTVLLPYGWKIAGLFDRADDKFVSARSSQSWFTIGCSLYIGAVGTWVLTVPVGIGVNNGMWGILGYAVACGFPWSIYLITGPALRNLMQYRAFTAVEFVKERFGQIIHIVFLIVALIYLMILLTSELIAIGNCMRSISPDFPPLGATISVALVTAAYSALGGFPATLLVDRIQAVLSVLLICISYGAVFGRTRHQIPDDIWSGTFTWQTEGLMTAACLIVSCFIVEQMNQGTWQRVIAARSMRDIRLGFGFGMLLMFPSMIVFGLAGPIAAAANQAGVITTNPESFGEDGLFLLLAQLPNWILILVVCMAVCLVTSTVDYVQTSIVAIIAGILPVKPGSLNLARLLGLALNVPAILIASFNPPKIIELMMFGNVLTTAVIPVVMLGFLEIPTQLGAVIGIGVALLLIFFIGLGRTGTFEGALSWGRFPNGYNWECLMTFFVVFFGFTIICYAVSWLHCYLSPAAKDQQIAKLAEIKRKDEEAALIVAGDAADVVSSLTNISQKDRSVVEQTQPDTQSKPVSETK